METVDDKFTVSKALRDINSHTEKEIEKYIFTTDVGQHQMWAAHLLKVANTKSWLSSG
jgi:thiamine pyrophosphate-dependent acetolactate synthase large subunit-like protein